LSGAFKRTGVKLGIGRYLYGLSETWVDILETRPSGVASKYIHYVNDKKTGIKGYWISPSLPDWALPQNTKKSTQPKKQLTVATKPKKDTDVHTESVIDRSNFWEDFKAEMRKIYKQIGKEKFFSDLNLFGYQNIQEIEGESEEEMQRILEDMINCNASTLEE
jgi:hypothetical protein